MLNIGLEIRILRERLQISSKDLAQKIGLSQSQMSRLEKGERRIDTRVLHKISGALGVEPAFFFRSAGAAAEGQAGGGRALPSEGAPAAIPFEHLGKLVRGERHKKHWTIDEFAAKVGRTKAYLIALEEGKHPLEADLADRISKVLRLSPNFFLKAQEAKIESLEAQLARLHQALAESQRGREGAENSAAGGTEAGGSGSPARSRRLPLFGSLGAGLELVFGPDGNPVGEPEDFLSIPGLDGQGCFALTVAGDAMVSPVSPSFREGDIVIFSASGLPRSRDLVLARPAALHGHEPPLFRQIFFEAGGAIRLQPLNLSYPARTFSRKDILGLWTLVIHLARN
ncbi:MAG: helix-turn-helix domain-containing protein [Planctomycetes bacterium]|nr:helix-turn-helix domain-containing protein [Planctomycetota bacterium]